MSPNPSGGDIIHQAIIEMIFENNGYMHVYSPGAVFPIQKYFACAREAIQTSLTLIELKQFFEFFLAFGSQFIISRYLVLDILIEIY